VAAAGEDAEHLAQGRRPRFHIAKAEGDRDGVEGGVWEGKMEGVGDYGVPQALCAGALEHGLAEIRACDPGAGRGALDGEGEIAAAGGKIEEGGGSPAGDDGGGARAPQKIETAGEEMVCEIVPSRY